STLNCRFSPSPAGSCRPPAGVPRAKRVRVPDVDSDVPPVLRREVVDRICVITLDRPERRNALNGPLVAALDAAVKEAADDPAVKVVVLTGAAPEGGHGGFCSGGDVKDASGPGMELGVPRDALEG